MRITPECTVFRFRRPTIKCLPSYAAESPRCRMWCAGEREKNIPTNARENTADVRGKKRTWHFFLKNLFKYNCAIVFECFYGFTTSRKLYIIYICFFIGDRINCENRIIFTFRKYEHAYYYYTILILVRKTVRKSLVRKTLSVRRPYTTQQPFATCMLYINHSNIWIFFRITV